MFIWCEDWVVVDLLLLNVMVFKLVVVYVLVWIKLNIFVFYKLNFILINQQ